jgi:hypothetical protein
MTTGTMHMGGYATGAARSGAACPAVLTSGGISAPTATKPWHETNAFLQVMTVFGIDRPIRRPSERFP